MERQQGENMEKISTVQVLTEEEAEQIYQELLSHIDDLDEFKKAAQQYELEIEQRILYEKIVDMEFLLYGTTEEC